MMKKLQCRAPQTVTNIKKSYSTIYTKIKQYYCIIFGYIPKTYCAMNNSRVHTKDDIVLILTVCVKSDHKFKKIYGSDHRYYRWI